MKLYVSREHPKTLAFECPGCGGLHEVLVEGEHAWKWNGSMTEPTFQPSLLVRWGGTKFRCHSFVTDGMIEFLPDSTHKLAGKTVALGEIIREAQAAE